MYIDEMCCIDWVLDWYHLYFHFQKFVHSFQVGPKFGYKFGIFMKCSKQIFGKDFGKLYVQRGDKFQCTDKLGTF